MYRSQSPYNLNEGVCYDVLSDESFDRAVSDAQVAFNSWRDNSVVSRIQLLESLVAHITIQKQQLAKLITLEMGKLIKESLAEVEKCIALCRYYIDNSESVLVDQITRIDGGLGTTVRRPYGSILLVMPWNFPFWQVLRCAIPIIISGNVVILKHSSIVPQCASAIADLFKSAGFPAGIFTNLFASKDQIARCLTEPMVHGLSVTGSTKVGIQLNQLAAKNLLPTVMELGGSDPSIILSDADLDNAVAECVHSRMINCGQSCIGAKRFIILEDVYDDFLERFKHRMEDLTFGSPLKALTTIGPMASLDLRDELHQQVRSATGNGAKLTIGGYIPKNMEGAFYPPTIIENISTDNPIYYQELFGPVAMFFKAQTIDEAIEIANDSQFGLGASIYSKDIDAARALAKSHIETGSVAINKMMKSYPEMPFGGIKSSGIGAELSREGLFSFTYPKAIVE